MIRLKHYMLLLDMSCYVVLHVSTLFSVFWQLVTSVKLTGSDGLVTDWATDTGSDGLGARYCQAAAARLTPTLRY